MDEIIKLVSEKTGLSEEMAEEAVTLVLDYVKEKLPDPIAGRLDALLEGDAASDLLGGLFGG